MKYSLKNYKTLSNMANDKFEFNFHGPVGEHIDHVDQMTVNMSNKRTFAIFFDDLNTDAQKRIVGDELYRVLGIDKEAIRVIDIEHNLYGYDPDPKKQTVEQHIHVGVVDDDRKIHPWLMVWNCMDAEFTTIMKEDQNPTKH